MFKHAFAALVLLSQISFAYVGYAQKNSAYPLRPDPTLTPGALCEHATRMRYPENIKYCERDVDPQTKWQVIQDYVHKFGYNITSGNRGSFKIDHYIPLCMGGSNDISNLWPQHESVYQKTDPMEPAMCEKMSMGRLKQAEAINLIKEGKNDFSKIPSIMAYVNRL